LVEAKVEVEAKDSEVVTLLVTIPGVGDFTALLIVAEIGEIDRFATPEKLSSYSGLTPSVHSSGNKTRTGEITKQGNPWLRWALVEASWKLKNKSDHFQEFFERVAKKKGKNVAIVGTARKLAVAIWHMWKRREPFKEPA
ncbi:MAG: IS110 family transposase, partial [Candidatus Bipolaricaulia bacterium]